MVTFKEMLNSEAYQKEAENWSKTFISVSFCIAAYFAFFSDFQYGWHWLWILPVLLFGSSIVLALPSMVLFTYLLFLYSREVNFIFDGSVETKNLKGKFLKFIKNIWSIFAPILCGFIVYQFFLFLA